MGLYTSIDAHGGQGSTVLEEEGVGSPEARVMGRCELSNSRAGNRTKVP